MYPVFDDRLRYIYYDLRKDGVDGIAKIHLPEGDDHPVVLHVREEDYVDVKHYLVELLVNEGDVWFNSRLVVTDGPGNKTDLVPFDIYIVIAHRDLLIKYGAAVDPKNFAVAMTSMQKFLVH